MARKLADRLVAVYVLVDPRQPNAVRYVGSAVNPTARLSAHRRDNQIERHTKKAAWLRSLVEDGVEVEMKVLYRLREPEAAAKEAELYRHYLPTGLLLNDAVPRRRGFRGAEDHLVCVERVVKPCGNNGAHIMLPGGWVGKKVTVTVAPE